MHTHSRPLHDDEGARPQSLLTFTNDPIHGRKVTSHKSTLYPYDGEVISAPTWQVHSLSDRNFQRDRYIITDLRTPGWSQEWQTRWVDRVKW
jgi:hypothetical protein